MSTLPIFDSVNNAKIFNGSSQYMQVAPTSINLANGFAITSTFTPTTATATGGFFTKYLINGVVSFSLGITAGANVSVNSVDQEVLVIVQQYQI